MGTMEELVTLIDENDNEIGVEGKMAAHRSGKLHRAISVFVFDSASRLLLQKRASGKYHSGGLWSNTCCSHPRPGEQRLAAAQRRLQEEMGFDCELTEVFSFVYRAILPNALIEHEYDYVFFGRHDGLPQPDPEEVEGWKWVELMQLKDDLQTNPHEYTFWLAASIDRVIRYRQENSALD